MALILKINGIDKSDQVNWPSLQKMDVLSKEPDRLEFEIRNYGTKTYRPALNDEVTLEDGQVKIFGGTVVETRETHNGMLRYFRVVCTDYQRSMDQKLVNKTYEGQTAEQIINDIKTNYLPAGFTTTNVVGPAIVPKIVFNDEAPSKCLQRIADLLGNHDWYVDYDKDIHFFEEGEETAPFNIDDTSGNYVWNSLEIERNTNQLRNTIIVRGGEKESGTITDTKVADGQQRTFVAKPKLQNLTIQKSTNGGSSWSTLTFGIDGKDDPTTKDVLYNSNTGMIIFPEATKPANGHYVRWSGTQVYPIKIIRRDVGSVAQYGEWQYVIRDATIKSEDTAKRRAAAEIKKYAKPATEGTFRTYRSGLRSGQTITVSSSVLGIPAQVFKIVRVILTARSPSSFEYEVHILASEDVGILDVFSKLLVSDPALQLATLGDEVIVQAEAWTEDVDIADNFATNPFGTNVKPIPVAGPYYGTGAGDQKRVLCLSGSLRLL